MVTSYHFVDELCTAHLTMTHLTKRHRTSPVVATVAAASPIMSEARTTRTMMWKFRSMLLIMNLLYHFTRELCTESDIQVHFLGTDESDFQERIFRESCKV